MKNLELKEKIKAQLGADPLAAEIEQHIEFLEDWLERIENMKWTHPTGTFAVDENERDLIDNIGKMAVDMMAEVEQSTHAGGSFDAQLRGMATTALGLAYAVLLREWPEETQTMIHQYVTRLLKNVKRMDVVGTENPL